MKTVNAIGKPCPLPIIETKKAIKELDGRAEQLEILVDNVISQQNLEKMATGMGYACDVSVDENNIIHVVMSVTEQTKEQAQAMVIPPEKNFVISFGKNTLGDGDKELGAKLMKMFIYSLTELDELPQSLLFFNSGAFLTAEGSEALEDLKVLESKGVRISTCGVCLNFYNLTEKLAVGEITNMFTIVNTIEQATNVFTP